MLDVGRTAAFANDPRRNKIAVTKSACVVKDSSRGPGWRNEILRRPNAASRTRHLAGGFKNPVQQDYPAAVVAGFAGATLTASLP